MSNLDRLRDAYDRYSRRDLSFVDEFFAPGIRWNVPGPRGEVHGTAAVKEIFQGLAEQFSAHTIELADWIEGDGRVWCHVRHTFTNHSGAAHKVEAMHLWQIAHGKVTALDEIADTLGFAVAAGMILPEALQGG